MTPNKRKAKERKAKQAALLQKAEAVVKARRTIKKTKERIYQLRLATDGVSYQERRTACKRAERRLSQKKVLLQKALEEMEWMLTSK